MTINLSKTKFVSLIDYINRQVRSAPDQIAFEYLVDGETQAISLTYGELDKKARAIAANLQSYGVDGERALLLYPPGLEYITAFIGCLYAGIVAVPAYPPDLARLERSLPRFMAIINDACPKFSLTTSPVLQMANLFLLKYPGIHEMIWLATDKIENEPNTGSWKNPEIQPDTLAFLQYTSGSTSDPKGVMLSHGNLMANLEAVDQAFKLDTQRDRGMFWIPTYHDMGLIGGVIGTLYAGITTTLMSPLDFLQRPYRWLYTISRVRATISGGPNFAYELCAQRITPEQKKNLDLSCWQVAVDGAEPVHPETLERFADAFSVCGFRPEALYPCYGLAESTLMVTAPSRWAVPHSLRIDSNALAQNQVIPSKEHESGSSYVSCGYPRLDHKVIIVDAETREQYLPNEVGITTVGEIWVSGPSIAQGYWNRPEESQAILQARLKNDPAEMYLRTGDLGFMKDGELYITGRIKDLIIIDGLNHYPQDVERTVEASHPALRVGCSAAFSIDVDGCEQLVIVAEMEDIGKISQLENQDDLYRFMNSVINNIRLAVANDHDLRIHQVVLLKPGSIPKTASAKIQRHACRADYLNNKLDLWKP